MTVVLRLDDRLLEGLARSAADVERPHRQLRARLANRLRGDNADRFAQFHELAGGEVASVAHARKRRARIRRSGPSESSDSSTPDALQIAPRSARRSAGSLSRLLLLRRPGRQSSRS